jgi:hypothetical protein
MFDRRWLLIVVQGCLVLTGMALTILTIAGQMTPALLLTLTFCSAPDRPSPCLPTRR